MKKFLTAVIILSLMTAAFAGCSANSTSSSSSSSSASESEPADNGTTDSSAAEENGTTDNAGTAEGGASSEGASESEENTEFIPDPDGRAAKMGAAAMEAVEWPAMMEVTDNDLSQSFFGIDLSMCEDFYIANQLISAQLNEIVIAKPAEGMEDELKAAFDAHYEYIQTDAAFYPEQEASAAGAVEGTTDDGYYYIVVHENGSDAAAALLAVE